MKPFAKAYTKGFLAKILMADKVTDVQNDEIELAWKTQNILIRNTNNNE